MNSYSRFFFAASGWIAAAITWVHFGKQIDLKNAIYQDSINMQQISFFLWDYAQKHNGKLPETLEQGLSPHGATEPLAFIYEFLTPNADLFSLPGNTPILQSRYDRVPGYEMVMYASGQTSNAPRKPNKAL